MLRLDRKAPALASFRPRFFEENALHAPLHRAASRLATCGTWPSVTELDAALRDLAPLRFVLQAPRPRGARRKALRTVDELYDGRIAQGAVPTRERSWHDLLNALVWATFPRAKLALHGRQHTLLAARTGGSFTRLPGERTREQDCLALVDEGGVLLLASGAVSAAEGALAAGDGAALGALIRSRAVVPVLFGHALYESLVGGQEGIHGSAFVLPLPDAAFDPANASALLSAADEALAARLADPSAFTLPEALARVPIDAATLAPEEAAAGAQAASGSASPREMR